MSAFGFLNCHKPVGMTSRDVVNVVQKRIRPTKVGHAGTLDPLAEGVLVLGLGPAVRLVPYVQQLSKHYLATFRLGATSQSGDLEGEITEHPHLPLPTLEKLELAACQLTGRIRQTPPAHSAIWVNGKRAYKRIRSGESVQMPSREVTIERCDVLAYDPPHFKLNVVCGSGTYIRTLGIDLAELAGSCAVMSQLNRIRVGNFDQVDSWSLDQLREQPIESLSVPAAHGVMHLPKVTIDEEQAIRLGHGLPLRDAVTTQLPGLPAKKGLQALIDSGKAGRPIEEAAAITEDGRLRAIVRPKSGEWRPYRVFPRET